jgi:hypothetical protein
VTVHADFIDTHIYIYINTVAKYPNPKKFGTPVLEFLAPACIPHSRRYKRKMDASDHRPDTGKACVAFSVVWCNTQREDNKNRQVKRLLLFYFRRIYFVGVFSLSLEFQKAEESEATRPMPTQ